MDTAVQNTSGSMTYKVHRAAGPGLAWKLRNNLRWSFIRGWMGHYLAHVFAGMFGFATITSSLELRLRKANGTWVNYGVVGYRQVTTVGITAMALSFGAQASPGNFYYHGFGTGSNAEAAANTTLHTELTTEYTGDVRPTGTHTEAAGVYTTVATMTLDSGTPTVTEHGIFTANAAGSLLDKTLFTGIAMASGDSIVATYNLTFTAGG